MTKEGEAKIIELLESIDEKLKQVVERQDMLDEQLQIVTRSL